MFLWKKRSAEKKLFLELVNGEYRLVDALFEAVRKNEGSGSFEVRMSSRKFLRKVLKKDLKEEDIEEYLKTFLGFGKVRQGEKRVAYSLFTDDGVSYDRKRCEVVFTLNPDLVREYMK